MTAIDGSPVDTWLQWERLIFIRRANQNNRLDALPGDGWRLRERPMLIRCAIVKWPCDLHWTVERS